MLNKAISFIEKGFFFEILFLFGIGYLFWGKGLQVYESYIGRSKGVVASYIESGKYADPSVTGWVSNADDVTIFASGAGSMEMASITFVQTLQQYFENMEYENVLRVNRDTMEEESDQNAGEATVSENTMHTDAIEGEELSGSEPSFQTVQVSDFSNSVFLGDSRVVGLMKYGELNDYAQFYASTGLTIYKLFQSPIATVEGKRGKVTVDEAFSERQFDRIYLCVGINEMGTGDVDYFVNAYSEAINHIRELQPEAQIYIQSIIAVTQKRSDQKDYINNEGIYARNEGLKTLADNRTIFYLDVNSVLCDENGALNNEYTSDGVHLKAQYLALWREYLLQHVVEK